MSPEDESTLAAHGQADVAAGEWVSARGARAVEVLARLVQLPRRVRAYRDLVRTTLRRDLAARFQGTVLGWAWPLLQPLLLFAIYYFVFAKLFQQRMPDLPEDQNAALGVYMFSGMVAWSALAESLARGTGVIVDNGNLIKKLAFPSELLPLNVVLASLSTMLFGVAAFVLAVCFTPIWPHPGWSLLWLPVLVLLQGVFTFGLVLFLSTLQVFLRDTAQFVATATMIWMFLTPVFWVPAAMGEKIAPYLSVVSANPTYHLLCAWRGALMGDLVVPGEDAIVSVAAIPAHLGVFALWALASYIAGYTFFILSQRRFADEV